MSYKRHAALLVAATTFAGLVGMAHPAGAVAAPANDKITGAQVVGSLPFTAAVDTRGATTDNDDKQVNESCGAPATNNSVWYEYNATKASQLFVDTTGSNFSSGVIIAEGTRGNLDTVACGPVMTNVPTAPGTRYWILVFDDTGSGGSLKLDIHGPGPKPTNDKSSGAKVVGSLPYHDSLDTSSATTDSQDTQANASCGAPAVTKSVWYKFTAGAKNTNVLFDASLSDFDSAIIVATGKPGALTSVGCGPETVIVPTIPGTTYWIIVFDIDGIGGALDLHITEAPPAPAISINSQPTVGVGPKGNAYVHATYTCRHADQTEGIVEIVEIVGNKVAFGIVDDLLPSNCDGTPHAMNGFITPTQGKFAPGKAAEFRSGLACNELQCAQFDATSVAHLVAGGAPSTGAPSSTHHLSVPAGTRYNSRRVLPPFARSWGR